MIIYTCTTHPVTSVVIRLLCPSKSTKKTKTSTCAVNRLNKTKLVLFCAGLMHAAIGQFSVARVLPLALMSGKAVLKCRRGLAIF